MKIKCDLIMRMVLVVLAVALLLIVCFGSNQAAPALAEGDTVEIYLTNPHKFGNRDAYNEFLSSIYFGSYEQIGGNMIKSGLPKRMLGLTLIILAIMLLAVLIAFGLLRIYEDKLTVETIVT